jgi:hypothetical protein
MQIRKNIDYDFEGDDQEENKVGDQSNLLSFSVYNSEY